MSINLDPGWYRYKCVWKDQYQEQHQFVNQFFVQITYEMFRQIAPLRPRISKGRQTSGGIRYSCGMSGCNSVLTTKYAIIEHEKNHEGSTVFRDVEWRPDIAADGTMTSKGIVILGGPPKGAIAAEPKKATLPPQFVQQMEAERTTAPPPAVAETPAAPKRRGRPPGSKGKGNPGALAAYRAKKAEEKAVQESLVNA